MLPASYFNGERLAAYLQILKEWEDAKLLEATVLPATTLVVHVEVANDNLVDDSIGMALCEVEQDKIVVDLTPIDREISVGLSSGPKIVVDSVDMDHICKKMSFPEERVVTVKCKRFSKEVREVREVFVIFSKITMKVTEILVGDNKLREFLLTRDIKNEKRILGKVKAILDTKVMFPGTEFAGIKSTDLHMLRSNEYVCAEKLNGTRYLMYVEKGKCFFIDRSSRLFYSNHDFEYSENFVLDGEMIAGAFVVFDAICDGNMNIASRNLSARVLAFQTIVDRVNQKDIFCCQRFYPMTELHKVYSKAEEGVVFLPLQSPYVAGFSRYMFKFKRELDTVDLKVFKDGNKFVYKSVHYLPHGAVQFVFFSKATGVDDKVGKIVEVKYKDGVWCYLRERIDKRMPNSVKVADEIKRGMANPVLIEDLLALVREKKS